MDKRLFLIILSACAFLFIDIFLLRIYFSQVKTNSSSVAATNQFSEAKNIDSELPMDNTLVILTFVGDISFSRQVERVVRKNKNINYPFLKIYDYLKVSDLIFGNLETPITAGREIRDGEMLFRSNPGTEGALKTAGFTIVSLANNHTANFGVKGLSDTIANLNRAGIRYVGFPKDSSETYRPAYIELKGLKFAFFAFVDPKIATDFKFSLDEAKIAQEIKNAQYLADYVIVSVHAGNEYKNKPNRFQTNLAHLAIDAGADLVIGHHPHVVQSIEIYQGKYIIYSLGNFVFDQMWSRPTREGLIVKAVFSKDGINRLIFIPVIIENYSQPRLATPVETESILSRLNFPLKINTSGEGEIAL